MEIDPKKLYSVKELSLFCLSERSWWRKIKNKEITYLKLGRLYFVRGQDLLEYLDKNTVNLETQ